MAGTADVVVKLSEPIRVAELVAAAAGPGPKHVAPVFARLAQQLIGDLRAAGVKPGISVGRYGPRDDGGLDVHVGFDISDQIVAGSVSVVEWPVVLVASLRHEGPLESLVESYGQIADWIRENGRTSAGLNRELYHQFDDGDAANTVVELQIVLRD